MSTVDYNFEIGGLNSPQPVSPRLSAPSPSRQLHRIPEVPQQQGGLVGSS